MVNYKEAAEMAKTLLSVAAIIFGVVGIVVVIASYFLISPIIDKGQDAALKQIDAAVLILDVSENTIGNLSTMADPLPNTFKSAGESMTSLSTSLALSATAFEELSAQVPADQRQPLLTAGNNLRLSSSSLNATGSDFKALYDSLRLSGDAIKQQKTEVSKSKRDIQKMKEDVRQIFASIKTAFLIMMVLFVLIYAGFISFAFVMML